MDKDVTHKGEDNGEVYDDPMEGKLKTYDIEQPHAPVPSDEKPKRRRWFTETFLGPNDCRFPAFLLLWCSYFSKLHLRLVQRFRGGCLAGFDQ